MKTIRRIAIAAAVCLVLGATVFLVLPRGGQTLAFADFADTFTAIRTMTCRVTIDMKLPPEAAEKMPPGMKLTDGKMVMTGKTMMRAPFQMRSEMQMPDPATGKTTTAVQVFDMSQRKMLQFMPSQKMAMLMRMENVPDDDPRMKQQGSLFDMRKMIAEAREGKTGMTVESLGEEVVDGRRIARFSVGTGAMTMSISADVETAMPTRLEVTMDMGSPIHMVMDDFRGNVPLDESLFSLDVPEGYTVQEMKMDASLPKLEDLGNLLRFVAEQNEGTLPDELPDMRDWQRLIEPVMKAKEKEFKADKPEEMKPGQMQEMMDAMMPAMRGIQFVATLAEKNDWHYVGKGVKLGGVDRPIFWYKPADSEKYQVLYADLGVKEVDADAVPQVEPPSP